MARLKWFSRSEVVYHGLKLFIRSKIVYQALKGFVRGFLKG